MSAPTEVRMPDLGTAASEVSLVAWLKEEGQTVRRGEPLCLVETDKAMSELESVADGILLKQMAGVGDKVEAGDVIALVGQPDAKVESRPVAEKPQDAGHRVEFEAATRPKPTDGGSRPVKASPLILNLARRAGVDLTRVAGTGPGGQITRVDLLKAQERPTDTPTGPEPLSRNQLAVARTVAAQWREAVPISLGATIRMEQAIAFSSAPAERSGDGAFAIGEADPPAASTSLTTPSRSAASESAVAASLCRRTHNSRRPSFDALFVFAAAKAIREVAVFQAHVQDDALIRAEAVNLAVAMSSDAGLFLPVVRRADQKSLAEIDDEIRQLASQATTGQLTPEQLTGATFSISNLGMFPVDFFTAVIPSRQSGILTVGRMRDEVRFREDRCLSVEKVCQVVLTVDHRLVNGREAAELLTRIKEALESL
jgi:pyruvate dehydrogenase E2 component (dihydrolipoamide acetyltransferase)